MKTLTIDLTLATRTPSISAMLDLLNDTAKLDTTDVVGVRFTGLYDSRALPIFKVTLSEIGAALMAKFLNYTVSQLEDVYAGEWETM